MLNSRPAFYHDHNQRTEERGTADRAQDRVKLIANGSTQGAWQLTVRSRPNANLVTLTYSLARCPCPPILSLEEVKNNLTPSATPWYR